MRTFMVLAAAAAGLSALATPAQAQLVSSTNPDAVLSAATEAGLTDGKMVITTSDDPYIELKHGDLKTLVFFMNCDESHKNCATIQYYLGFTDADDATVDKMNDWNRNRRFGHAFIDSDGDPVLEMDVDLDFGGLPRKNVVESFKTWQALADAFHSFLFG